uniref:Uncharacterized protein n=2 Tax=Anguilla anguilla TaxID=7936 RepID=A0A0E9T450_ANGAN
MLQMNCDSNPGHLFLVMIDHYNRSSQLTLTDHCSVCTWFLFSLGHQYFNRN